MFVAALFNYPTNILEKTANIFVLRCWYYNIFSRFVLKDFQLYRFIYFLKLFFVVHQTDPNDINILSRTRLEMDRIWKTNTKNWKHLGEKAATVTLIKFYILYGTATFWNISFFVSECFVARSRLRRTCCWNIRMKMGTSSQSPTSKKRHAVADPSPVEADPT